MLFRSCKVHVRHAEIAVVRRQRELIRYIEGSARDALIGEAGISAADARRSAYDVAREEFRTADADADIRLDRQPRRNVVENVAHNAVGLEIAGGRRPADRPDVVLAIAELDFAAQAVARSEEHTSELQSLMRISYAVFCLKKKTNKTT